MLGWDAQKHSDSFGVGEPNPNTEVRLVDPETGEDVPEGGRGELWARGPNITKGYWRNEKATKETITPDGWLKTGDVAMVNEHGCFFIVDRIKVGVIYRNVCDILTEVTGTHQGQGQPSSPSRVRSEFT